MKNWNRPKLLVFDVNETLLNMEPVKVAINKFFKIDSAFQTWFSTLLQYAMVESINPPKIYLDFGQIAKASLYMLSKKLEISLIETEAKDLLALLSQLLPHKDVENGLKVLKEKGYKLVALTNGPNEVLKTQMAFADLTQYFNALYSVETVKSFKPQRITYEYVLNQQKVQAEEAMMVATHSWDIAGANAAGLQTAFIERKGQMYYPLMNEPTLIFPDIIELAQQL
jgi:2-haloacid dehalogenase